MSKEAMKLALEAGAIRIHERPKEVAVVGNEAIERFAELVRADEREACAKVCEPKTPRPCDCEWCDCGNSTSARMVAEWDESAIITKAIRARSST